MIISSFGVYLSVDSIAKVNSIHNFDGVINIALNNLIRFVEDTQRVSYATFNFGLAENFCFYRK